MDKRRVIVIKNISPKETYSGSLTHPLLNNLYYPGSKPLPIRNLIAQELLVTVRLS